MYSSLMFNAFQAFKHKQEFVFRPGDVWVDLVLQIGSHIAANSAKYKDIFVDWHGKKEVSSNSTSTSGILKELIKNASKLTKVDIEKLFVRKFTDRPIPKVHTQLMRLSGLCSVKEYTSYSANCIVQLKKGGWKVIVEGDEKDWNELMVWIHELLSLLGFDDWNVRFCDAIKKLLTKDETFLSLACSDQPNMYHPKYVYGWLKEFHPFDTFGKYTEDSANVECPAKSKADIEVMVGGKKVVIEGGIDLEGHFVIERN
jgi:Domain of unknown function (DUF4419)